MQVSQRRAPAFLPFASHGFRNSFLMIFLLSLERGQLPWEDRNLEVLPPIFEAD